MGREGSEPVNLQETMVLARFVKAMFPQQPIDEYTPEAWQIVLAKNQVRAEDAKEAVVTLAGRQKFIAIGEIVTEVKRFRAARFHAIDAQQLDEMLGASADPDDVDGFLEAVRTERKLIGDGVAPEHVPAVAAAIHPRTLEIIAGIGSGLSDAVSTNQEGKK